MRSFEAFLSHIKSSAQAFTTLPSKSVLLIHHNDADGLSSGAILSAAFERMGLRVRRYCLEKPYPLVVKLLLKEAPDSAETVVFADFASGMLETLQDLNVHGRPIFVLDHHQVLGKPPGDITLINCLPFGINADPDCSASTIAGLFAEALSPENIDLCALTVVGAIGDGLKTSAGRLCGLNDYCTEEVAERGDVTFSGSEYYLSGWPHIPLSKLVRMVNVLGSAGYFRGGPDIAIKGLLAGDNPLCWERANQYESELQAAVTKFTKGNFLKHERSLQWFTLDSSFAAFGVKTVGLLCEQLIAEKAVDARVYLAGLQEVPDEIPGLGRIALDQIKVSMRAPSALRARITAKEVADLTQVLPASTRAVGGFVDACHPYAAATTIPKGTEQKFLESLILETDRSY